MLLALAMIMSNCQEYGDRTHSADAMDNIDSLGKVESTYFIVLNACNNLQTDGGQIRNTLKSQRQILSRISFMKAMMKVSIKVD